MFGCLQYTENQHVGFQKGVPGHSVTFAAVCSSIHFKVVVKSSCLPQAVVVVLMVGLWWVHWQAERWCGSSSPSVSAFSRAVWLTGAQACLKPRLKPAQTACYTLLHNTNCYGRNSFLYTEPYNQPWSAFHKPKREYSKIWTLLPECINLKITSIQHSCRNKHACKMFSDIQLSVFSCWLNDSGHLNISWKSTIFILPFLSKSSDYSTKKGK